MIVYGSGLADGNQHQHHNLPVVIAGRGRGTLRPGRRQDGHERCNRERRILRIPDRTSCASWSLIKYREA
jgi:hypothetical protein